MIDVHFHKSVTFVRICLQADKFPLQGSGHELYGGFPGYGSMLLSGQAMEQVTVSLTLIMMYLYGWSFFWFDQLCIRRCLPRAWVQAPWVTLDWPGPKVQPASLVVLLDLEEVVEVDLCRSQSHHNTPRAPTTQVTCSRWGLLAPPGAIETSKKKKLSATFQYWDIIT